MAKPLSDVQILEMLCAEPYLSKLGSKAAKAFPEWLERGRELTPPMRRWLRSTADVMNIQVAPSENLFSQLTPERQAEQRARAAKFAPKLPWEK
jgi:hypothetical protein